MADEMLFEEAEEYQVMTIEDEEGESYDFAVTDVIEVEGKSYAILNLIEGDEITGAYIVYGANIDDENKEIELFELPEEEEDMISDLYYEEVLQPEEESAEEE